jgi:hypothetical protein
MHVAVVAIKVFCLGAVLGIGQAVGDAAAEFGRKDV